jgi:hypothetical protein
MRQRNRFKCELLLKSDKNNFIRVYEYRLNILTTRIQSVC